jgi:trehalose-6-phosphate synthase
VIVQALRAMEAKTSPAEADKLEVALGELLKLRFAEDEIDRILGEVRKMEGTAFERFIARHGEERAKVIAEERAQVIAEERAQVIAEQLATERTARTLREVLLSLGRSKLGVPDEGLNRRLESLTDIDRLRDLLARVSSAASWDELLATP